MSRFLLVLLVLAAALPARAEVPVTGRSQDLRFSRAELIATTRPDFDRYMATLAADGLLERQSPAARRIHRLFDGLVAKAETLKPAAAEWGWEIVVTRVEDGGVFAMPDGKIFISAHWVGALDLTDEELALAIAHEMAHVLADHMLERLSAIAAARPMARFDVADLLQLLREQWTLLREIEPLMRLHEREADRIGMAIAHGSGIPLAEAITLFDKMARHEETREGFSLVRSHDSARDRKASLQIWIRAQAYLPAT